VIGNRFFKAFSQQGLSMLSRTFSDRKSLFQGFFTAGVVDAVKDIFLPQDIRYSDQDLTAL
jgi:hypothetical protein